MALAFVQGAVKSSGANPTSFAALATAVAVGDLLVLNAGYDGGVTGLTTSVTDNLGNTWVKVPSFDFANSGGSLAMDAWYCRVTVAGTITITVDFNSAATNINAVVQHFNGFTGTATLDQTAKSSNVSSTTVTSGTTPATTQAAELIVGLAVHASTASAFSLGSGFTNLTQNNIGARAAAMESKVVAATGTQTAPFTIAAARVSLGGVLTFYDAAGGTTTTTTTASTTTTTTTTAAPKPKTATLTDNMDDNSLGAEWTPTGASGASGANSGGVYTISLPASATATAYASLQSTGLYDLTGSYIYAKVVSVPLATQTSTDATEMFYIDANNWIRWVYEGGSLYAQDMKAGVRNTRATVAYNPTTHAFWQIVESGGVVSWQTSPDGATWTTQASITHGMTLTSGQVMFEAYCYAAQTNPGTFSLDFINTLSSTTTTTTTTAAPASNSKFLPFFF